MTRTVNCSFYTLHILIIRVANRLHFAQRPQEVENSPEIPILGGSKLHVGQYIILFLKMRNFTDLVTLFNLSVVPTVNFASFIGSERAKVKVLSSLKKMSKAEKGCRIWQP